MAKFRKSIGGQLIGTAVGVGGGVVANLLDTKVMPNQSDLVKIAVKAGVGAVLPMFMDNTITNALANSMIGVAGYQLSGAYITGDSASSGSGSGDSSGVTGLPASFNASIGRVRNKWVASHLKPSASVSGTVDSSLNVATMD